MSYSVLSSSFPLADGIIFCMYQIPEFVSAKADFGTDLAISTRTELDPGVAAATLSRLLHLRFFVECFFLTLPSV